MPVAGQSDPSGDRHQCARLGSSLSSGQRSTDPPCHPSRSDTALPLGGNHRGICRGAQAPQICFPPDQIEALIAMFRLNGELLSPEVSSTVSPDPGDTKFLDCANAAQADFLVTGNKRDFPDAPYDTTRVVTARELLASIAGEIGS